MSGIFDWLMQSPGGAMPAAANGTPPGPRGFNNLGLIGAGLSDLSSNMRGRPADSVANFGNALYQQGLMQRQIDARQAYAKAMQSGDPAAQLAARAQLFASGAVPANYAFPQMQRGYMVLPDGTGAQAIPGGPADPRVIAERAAAKKGQLPPLPRPSTGPDGQVVYVYGDTSDRP